jgi:hypothetical protein
MVSLGAATCRSVKSEKLCDGATREGFDVKDLRKIDAALKPLSGIVPVVGLELWGQARTALHILLQAKALASPCETNASTNFPIAASSVELALSLATADGSRLNHTARRMQLRCHAQGFTGAGV